jgi:co-chaperonin GroES (HSP10)
MSNNRKIMKPIGKYIVVKDIQETVTTESGLILSGEDTNQLRYKKASVIAAGTDVQAIEQGDELYYDKAHSFTMLIDDAQYTVISERDVVVVV